jgi:protein SCO1/2
VCPTTLYTLGEALRAPGGYDIQPIMITVDPSRDTPALMNAYVETEGFPEGLVGLSGSQAEVEAAISSFKAVARRAPIQGGSAAEYNMDHTSFLYVMDENWRLRAKMLSIGAQPADVAACIAAGLGAPT